MKDRIYQERIVKYINKINRYMEGIDTIEAFILLEEKVDAVILNLEQIGETVKKLSDDFTSKFPDIEWNNIKGLRNIISHEYEGIRIDIIYFASTALINEVLNKLKD